MTHIWIIRTSDGRINCTGGTEEDTKRKGEEMVAGTDETYILIE